MMMMAEKIVHVLFFEGANVWINFNNTKRNKNYFP